MPKFWTKSALFGYFWARILKNYGRICNQDPEFYRFAKFCRELKMRKLVLKSALLGYFWARVLKIYCHI